MKTFRHLDAHLGLVPASTTTVLSELAAGRGREEAFQRQNPQVLDSLTEIAIVQSAESSNAIEGVTASPERIIELVQKKTTPENRPEGEIAGYRDVLNTIHSSAKHIPFTPNVVLQFHRDLYALTPRPGGRWKGTENEVATFDSDGNKIEVVFKGTPPLETAPALEELHERYAEAVKGGEHAHLLLVGTYIFDFLMIHPFDDGNGRMSRLLSLLLLYQAGHEVGRFISLEKLIEQTKETYYESLRKSTPGWDKGEHNVWPWLNYFLGILSKAYKEFEERVGTLKSGRGSKAERIKDFIRSRTSNAFTFDEIQRANPDISYAHIRAELTKLRDAGIVKSPGSGRKEWQRLRSDF